MVDSYIYEGQLDSFLKIQNGPLGQPFLGLRTGQQEASECHEGDEPRLAGASSARSGGCRGFMSGSDVRCCKQALVHLISNHIKSTHVGPVVAQVKLLITFAIKFSAVSPTLK